MLYYEDYISFNSNDEGRRQIMKMTIKKGDKSIDIPVWGMFAVGVVVESIGRYVCKTVRSVTKTRHNVKEETEE